MKFGHYPQLLMNKLNQMMPDFTAMMPDFIKQGLFVGSDKKAEVHFGNGQVFTYLNLCHGNKCPSKKVTAFLLKYNTKILLDQSGDFLLTG